VLRMTSDATQAIEQILSDADIPDGAGLRIEAADVLESGNGTQPEEVGTLRIVIAAQATGGDQVVERAGARLFIEPGVSEFLDDKLLDISPGDDGVMFTLAEQP